MFSVYKIVRFSLLFFVKKMDRAHEVAITIISAFFPGLLSLQLRLSLTNDYICTQQLQQLKPDGSGVNIHCHHIVIGVKVPFCSPTEGTCLLRPFELFPFEPSTLWALNRIGGFLTFHGVTRANFLMLFAIIFTAAFSSCEGLICRAHCSWCRSGRDEQRSALNQGSRFT